MNKKLELNARSLQGLSEEETKQVAGGGWLTDIIGTPSVFSCGGDQPTAWCTAFGGGGGSGGNGGGSSGGGDNDSPAPTTMNVCSPGPA